MFAIAQGSTFDDLRREAAESLAALDFPGYAVGGVSVGEPEPEMLKQVAATTPFLPTDKPRYTMGLGLFMDNIHGHRLLVHNSSTAGGFSSVFYHYPDDKLTVIVLCNIDRGDAVNRIATRIAGHFVPALLPNAAKR